MKYLFCLFLLLSGLDAFCQAQREYEPDSWDLNFPDDYVSWHWYVPDSIYFNKAYRDSVLRMPYEMPDLFIQSLKRKNAEYAVIRFIREDYPTFTRQSWIHISRLEDLVRKRNAVKK